MVEDACASTSRFLAETVQTKITCDAVGEAMYSKETSPAFPDVSPDIYACLPTNDEFGFFTYKGGLTTPTFTEIVDWNLLDAPMEISADQLARLEKLILCYVEKKEEDGATTCAHANNVADEIGSTSRPPQDLEGRRVIH